MEKFDLVLMADWSARSKPAPRKPSRDAIWHCLSGGQPRYCRTRAEAEAEIVRTLEQARGRVLAGFDFSFSYPQWFLHRLGLDWRGLWRLLGSMVRDDEYANNRFEVAAALNREVSGRAFPFWGTPYPAEFLSATRPENRDGLAEKRQTEQGAPQSSFKLWGAGCVGSQTLLGIPMLERLRRRFDGEIEVWPFEATEARIVLAEVYPSGVAWRNRPEAVDDAKQVCALVEAFECRVTFPNVECRDEGWILRPASRR